MQKYLVSQLSVGIFPKISISVWYSIFQNVEMSKQEKGDALDDKYLSLGSADIVFTSILEVYQPILCCTSLSYLISDTVYETLVQR